MSIGGIAVSSKRAQARLSRRRAAEAREQAIERVVEDAHSLGANAMINGRFTTAMVMQGAAELLAYGTAVVVEDAES